MFAPRGGISQVSSFQIYPPYWNRIQLMAFTLKGRLEKVLRSAVVEKDRPLSRSMLPSQFYDLRYSSVDIDEALRLWAADD